MGCPGIMAWNVSLELGTEVGIRLLLFIVFVWTDLLEPFRRKIQPEEMWLYKNPTSTEDRVPTLHMFAIAYIVPVFTVLFIYFIRYGKPDLKPAFLAMSLGMVINGVLTNCIKLMVGRPRPDFYYRCFPDGLSNSEMDCSGLPTEVSEGLKSFPSGHSSHVFAGLGFLALYLAGKLRCFVPAMRAPGLRLIIVILPLFIAALIAISRTCDYKHHWQDVVVGSLLGFGCAFLAYRQYYPSLSGTRAGSPVHSVKLRHTSEVESTEGHFV